MLTQNTYDSKELTPQRIQIKDKSSGEKMKCSAGNNTMEALEILHTQQPPV